MPMNLGTTPHIPRLQLGDRVNRVLVTVGQVAPVVGENRALIVGREFASGAQQSRQFHVPKPSAFGLVEMTWT